MVPYRGRHTKYDEARMARHNFDGDDSGKESGAHVAQPLEPLTNSHVD
jgi:hypothetical protein